MFERYTEKARPLIFFARYEPASTVVPTLTRHMDCSGDASPDAGPFQRPWKSHSQPIAEKSYSLTEHLLF
jgi:hypothetical protein